MNQDVKNLRRKLPSLHSLILFEAAARYLNFSKAGRELSITQPAVSQGIRQLEAVLGHALFVRERRALSLTTQGQRLYAAVAGGLSSIAETVDEIAGKSQREVLIVASSAVMASEWLTTRLGTFREANPDVLIDLRSADRDEDLATNNIDVHLRLGDGTWPNCDAYRLWSEKIVPVCSRAYLAKSGLINSRIDLLSHQLIHYVDPYRFRIGWSEWLRAAGVVVPLSVPASLHVNDSLIALRAAENGEGIALGWRPSINRALDEGRLVPAIEMEIETGRDLFVVTPTAPNRRRVAVAFRDWLLNEAQSVSRIDGS